MRRLSWLAGSIVACLLLGAGPVAAEPQRPAYGPLGDREIGIANHGQRGVVELYVSPQTADAWGQDRLGDDVLDPGQSIRLKLGRMRDCTFDVLVVYDDTSREEQRGVNACRTRELAFDGHAATAPMEQQGPDRSVTVIDASPLPLQQLYLSPADAAQWGEDRLALSAMSVGEERKIAFRGDCIADIRVVFSNRAAEERRGLDLCAKPLLRISPGWTTDER